MRSPHPEQWRQRNQQKKAAGRRLLTLTASNRHTLTAHWLDPQDGSVHAESLSHAGTFPSLTPVLPEVAWDEREIHDLFGDVPEDHPDLRPLVRTPRWPQAFHPLARAQASPPNWHDVEPDNPAKLVAGEGITVMKVGPTHAGVIESGHFVFSLIGENVLHLDLHLFQNHRGIEALLEQRPVAAVAPLVTRICAADTVSHQTNWALAIEAMAGYQSAEELRWRRVILLEAERVLSHLNDLAQIPAGVGFQVAQQRALAMKETWQRGLKALFGHRLLFDTVGPGWAQKPSIDGIFILIDNLRQAFKPWRALVQSHHGFMDRMHAVGVVRQASAERLGAEGVAARAAGTSFDARTTMPLYQGLSIVPVVQRGGDVQARFLVRLDELEASLRIIEESATRLRRSPTADPPWVLPHDLTGHVVTYTESPHGLNVHDVEIQAGRTARYHVRPATYRNWPLLAHAVAGNAVADFPLINKSFELCYSCTDR